MAICQKSRASPCSPSTPRTRSRSPTEAPPMVTTRSTPRSCSLASARLSGRSRAMPRSSGSPPHCRTMAASATVLELTIWAAASGCARQHQLVASGEQRDARPPADRQPGVVERRGQANVTRGKATPGRQRALVAPEIEPGRTHEGPGLKRARDAHALALGARVSCRATASAPLGNRPPVKMRTASPRPSSRS